ncbi:MAG: segregation and condensation protein A [Sedimenticola sp.]
MSDSSKEREILMVMRKVLASIIKDTTPPPGTRHPLSDRTIEDVRMCLGLISARERELADAAGAVVEKPYFVDQQPTSNVVSINNIGKTDKEDTE